MTDLCNARVNVDRLSENSGCEYVATHIFMIIMIPRGPWTWFYDIHDQKCMVCENRVVRVWRVQVNVKLIYSQCGDEWWRLNDILYWNIVWCLHLSPYSHTHSLSLTHAHTFQQTNKHADRRTHWINKCQSTWLICTREGISWVGVWVGFEVRWVGWENRWRKQMWRVEICHMNHIMIDWLDWTTYFRVWARVSTWNDQSPV